MEDWNIKNQYWGINDADENYSESIDEDGNFSMSDKLFKKISEKTNNGLTTDEKN